MTGGARADAVLAELAPRLALGVKRVPITRELGPRDVYALRRVSRRIGALAPDVLHGHGAKGARAGAARRRARRNAIRAYTPHGGSLVYRPGTLERRLLSRAGMAAQSAHRFVSVRKQLHRRTVPRRDRAAAAMVRVVRNGIGEAEFAPITPRPDATDIVCVGELRPVKAIDVLIEALAVLAPARPPRQRDDRRRGAATRRSSKPRPSDSASPIRFVSSAIARRARRSPWAACWSSPRAPNRCPMWCWRPPPPGVPIIATGVGGVPEIFGPQRAQLIPPDDIAAPRSARSRPRSTIRRNSSRGRAGAQGAGAQRVLADARWWRAGSPPIARRSACDNSRNSHNQFLKIVHYVGARLSGQVMRAPSMSGTKALAESVDKPPSPARYSRPLPRFVGRWRRRAPPRKRRPPTLSAAARAGRRAEF